MEMNKLEVSKRLGELNKIKPKEFSAMELHGNRPLLRRVERKEEKNYLSQVNKQKRVLTKEMERIGKQSNFVIPMGSRGMSLSKGTGLPEVFPKAKEMPLKPIRKRTRLGRYTKY